MKNKTLGLYLHIPFCVRKCAYCDFLSGPAGAEEKSLYVGALLEEIREMGRRTEGCPVDSIFLGGGTPTTLSADQLTAVLRAVRQAFSVLPGAEITLEMNPGTDREELDDLLKNEVNRVSLGLQSTDRDELKVLGRIHTYEDLLGTYDHLRALGLANINIDLMSALPGQTMASWQRTLERVTALKPEHISAYSLIIEEGTPFFDLFEAGRLDLPDEETERDMYAVTEELLKARGYHRYEISNYARPGFESRHNSRYWTGGDYLGLGLGASSYFEGRRWKNTSDMTAYLENAGRPDRLREEMQVLTEKDKMEEFMFLGLRMMKGVSGEDFRRRFGREIEEIYGPVLEEQIHRGLMVKEADCYRLTLRGIDISNTVLAEFLL